MSNVQDMTKETTRRGKYKKAINLASIRVIDLSMRRPHCYSDVIRNPPQPRLVGIELNPGPPTSAAAVAPLTINSIFTDGMRLIFQFLTDAEWLISARACHHWVDVARDTPLPKFDPSVSIDNFSSSRFTRTCALRVYRRPTTSPEPTYDLPSLESAYFSSTSSVSLDLYNKKKSSGRSKVQKRENKLIQALEKKIRTVRKHTDAVTAMASLSVGSSSSSSSASSSSSSSSPNTTTSLLPALPFVFSRFSLFLPHLTSVEIDISESQFFILYSSFINIINSLPHLRQLTCGLIDIQPFGVWQKEHIQNCSGSELISLTLRCSLLMIQTEDCNAFIRSLSQLTQLHQLTLSYFALQVRDLDLTPFPLHLHHLRHFTFSQEWYYRSHGSTRVVLGMDTIHLPQFVLWFSWPNHKIESMTLWNGKVTCKELKERLEKSRGGYYELWRERIMKKEEEKQKATPAPRLVGIELNPGPPARLNSVFTDGLIFTFLRCHGWAISSPPHSLPGAIAFVDSLSKLSQLRHLLTYFPHFTQARLDLTPLVLQLRELTHFSFSQDRDPYTLLANLRTRHMQDSDIFMLDYFVLLASHPDSQLEEVEIWNLLTLADLKEKFEKDREKYQDWERRIGSQQREVTDSPHVAPLVGIELNPGPTISSPSNQLYADVIGLIYTFLLPYYHIVFHDARQPTDLLDLISVSRISHVWRATLSTCPSLELKVHLYSWSKYDHLSRSSLFRHLTFLNISQMPFQYSDGRRTIHLPSHLHEIYIPGEWQHTPGVNMDVSTFLDDIVVRDCQQLERFVSMLRDDEKKIDYSPLVKLSSTLFNLRLPYLRLTLTNVSWIRQLHQLRTLSCSSDENFVTMCETLTADGHQLNALQWITIINEPCDLRLLRALSRLPALTALEPDSFSACDIELTSILSTMKNLTSLSFEKSSDVDVITQRETQAVTQAISKLTKLRKLCWISQDAVLPYHQWIQMISSLPHLTDLHFISSSFALPSSWIQHLPALTKLSLIDIYLPRSFSQLCDGFTFSPPVTSLLDLSITMQCLSEPPNPDATKESHFSDVIKISSPNARMSNVIIRWVKTEEKKKKEKEETEKETPQPRLVGIEPNPGPPSLALYADVICIAYSYLHSSREILAAARTSHAWCDILLSNRTLSNFQVHLRARRIIGASLSRILSSLLNTRFSHQVRQLRIDRSCTLTEFNTLHLLPHLITLDIKIFNDGLEVSPDDPPRVVIIPKLLQVVKIRWKSRFACATVEHVRTKKEHDTWMPPKTPSSSASPTSNVHHFGPANSIQNAPDWSGGKFEMLFYNALTQCTQLHTLEVYSLIRHSQILSALIPLAPTLRSLSLNASIDLLSINQIRHLTNLTYLELYPPYEFNARPQPQGQWLRILTTGKELPLKHLQEIHLPNARWKSADLTALGLLTSLTKLQPLLLHFRNISPLRTLIHLRHLDLRFHVETIQTAQGSTRRAMMPEQQRDALIETLVEMKELQYLRIDQAGFLHASEYITLFSRLPNLTQLFLHELDPNLMLPRAWVSLLPNLRNLTIRADRTIELKRLIKGVNVSGITPSAASSRSCSVSSLHHTLRSLILDMSFTQVSAILMQHFDLACKSSFPNCRIILPQGMEVNDVMFHESDNEEEEGVQEMKEDEDEEEQKEVHGPRLVGIELNPGPPTHSIKLEMLVSMSWSSLYKDALGSIMQYADLCELSSASQCCRSWSSLLLSDQLPPRHLSLTLTRSASLKKFLQSRLRRHVTKIDFRKSVMVGGSDIALIRQHLQHLRSLSCQIDVSYHSTLRPHRFPSDQFPPHLESLTLVCCFNPDFDSNESAPSYTMMWDYMLSMIEEVSTISTLRELSIVTQFEGPTDLDVKLALRSPPPSDFLSPLIELPQLTSLTLSIDEYDLRDEHIEALRALPQLEVLHFSIYNADQRSHALRLFKADPAPRIKVLRMR